MSSPRGKKTHFALDDRGVGGTHLIQQQFRHMHRTISSARTRVDCKPPLIHSFAKRPYFKQLNVDYANRIIESPKHKTTVKPKVDTAAPASFPLLKDLYINQCTLKPYGAEKLRADTAAKAEAAARPAAVAGTAAANAVAAMAGDALSSVREYAAHLERRIAGIDVERRRIRERRLLRRAEAYFEEEARRASVARKLERLQHGGRGGGGGMEDDSMAAVSKDDIRMVARSALLDILREDQARGRISEDDVNAAAEALGEAAQADADGAADGGAKGGDADAEGGVESLDLSGVDPAVVAAAFPVPAPPPRTEKSQPSPSRQRPLEVAPSAEQKELARAALAAAMAAAPHAPSSSDDDGDDGVVLRPPIAPHKPVSGAPPGKPPARPHAVAMDARVADPTTAGPAERLAGIGREAPSSKPLGWVTAYEDEEDWER